MRYNIMYNAFLQQKPESNGELMKLKPSAKHLTAADIVLCVIVAVISVFGADFQKCLPHAWRERKLLPAEGNARYIRFRKTA